MKIMEGRPNISDAIKNRQLNLIINTPRGRSGMRDDSYIRMMAIQYKIPYMTTMAAARASVEGIEETKTEDLAPLALQEYHQEMADKVKVK
jgi:carbamoyl-phosphate synthase large subunit